MITADRAASRTFTAEGDAVDGAEPQPPTLDPVIAEPSLKLSGLEAIYDQAAIQPSRLGYTILKVAEMANSPHILGMSTEARRNAILMALDSAGVEVSFLVADAISRQRALNEYEEKLLAALKAFESERTEDGNKLQAELDGLAARYRARVQANAKEVAREQAAFQSWQRMRREESRRIADMAMLLVPAEAESGGDSLAALLDRAAASRKQG